MPQLLHSKITTAYAKQLIVQIQKLVLATNQRGLKMHKLIIRSLTDREEIREELTQFIINSKWNGRREELAERLAALYPTEMWNERTLNYMLNDQKNLDFAKVNQILDFIEPDEKVELSFNTLQEAIDELRLKLSDLNKALIEAKRTENKIDAREYNLISSLSSLIINKIQKFSVNVGQAVGQTLM